MPNEANFKKQLRCTLPKEAAVTSLETTTISGVPDLHICFKGKDTWLECKHIPDSPTLVKLRASQFIWFKRLTKNGGRGILVIKRQRNIDLYLAKDFTKLPKELIKPSGKDYILPTTGEIKIEPFYTAIPPFSVAALKEWHENLLLK